MKTLVTAQQIEASVTDLAKRISQQEQGRPLTVIAILTGSIVFLSDLVRKIDMPLRVGVIQTSSYQGTKRGELKIQADMMPDIRGRDVLLVDDIFDTGHTLVKVMELLKEFAPSTIRSAVLLLKRGKQEVEYRPDYVGFEIPDEFVVGYGLDYDDTFRNLPFLAALEPEDIASVTALGQTHSGESA